MINYIKEFKVFFLLILLLCMIFLSCCYGADPGISINEISKLCIALFLDGFNIQSTYYSIDVWHHITLFEFRLPKAILAVLVGIALGTSGALLQSLFRNPLVEPGFIGVSSGAALGVMFGIVCYPFLATFIFPPQISNLIQPYLFNVLAILGSFILTLLIYKMSIIANKTNIMVMLLSGIAINALAGSVIGILMKFANEYQMQSFIFWTLGSLNQVDWEIITISAIIILSPFGCSLFLIKKLDIFMLGDAESNHLGLNVEKIKITIIVLCSLMVGISVSFCGMIGFVGLVTPHIVRLIFGPKHRYVIICSALLGAILLVFSDIISTITYVPIGAITSIIGAPFFLWLIINQKRRFSYSE